jgi:2-keto-myo-inositol isomerase
MVAPRLGPEAFFALAGELGVGAVEIRNDLAGNAIADGTPAKRIGGLAEAAGVRILSINALQRFDDWSPARALEAAALADYAHGCGAAALVLVPTNDGSRPGRLKPAIEALLPILSARGLTGLIEPLGFATSALRRKAEALEAVAAVGGQATFRLVHDTFHHHLSGESAIFPGETGLVHISGVSDPALDASDMRDAHRGLIDAEDRLGTVAQLRALAAGGYAGFLSFEPFAAEVHDLADPGEAIRRSMRHVSGALSVAAA